MMQGRGGAAVEGDQIASMLEERRERLQRAASQQSAMRRGSSTGLQRNEIIPQTRRASDSQIRRPAAALPPRRGNSAAAVAPLTAIVPHSAASALDCVGEEARSQGSDSEEESGDAKTPPMQRFEARGVSDTPATTGSIGHSTASIASSKSPHPPEIRGSFFSAARRASLRIASVLHSPDDVHTFVSVPPPQVGMIRCRVERESSALFPLYRLFLEGEKGAQPRMLMAAQRKKACRTSHYVICLNDANFTRDSPSYEGKVRGNFVGTEFSVYDRGERAGADRRGECVRSELAHVEYKANMVSNRGQRHLTVVLPRVDSTGTRVPFTAESLARGAVCEPGSVLVLESRKAQWSETLGRNVVDFGGRGVLPSVKNMQLVSPHDTLLLQLGKVGPDAFTLDFQYPMCGLQAFGIALTAFDPKLGVE
eukprot:Hpha_TRINITY_DN15987_c2_g9::TRINITY_DN15987_c2_g9_i1::g.72328::m.72328